MVNHHDLINKIHEMPMSFITIVVTRSILDGYKLILNSLLALMGISTFTSKECVIFCRVSVIGNVVKSLFNGSSMMFR